jgi:transcriptional regulator with XRE-family HTH domain
MEQQISSAFIRAERQRRGWSQEQLAAAAGLGIRTIQRLEATGIGSAETAKCLAAVFQVPLTQLMVPKRSKRPLHLRLWAAFGAACIALASSLLVVSGANANDVAMAVVVTTETGGQSKMNIEVKDGQQTEIKLEKELRLLLTPRLQRDPTVLMVAEIFAWNGNAFTLASKPKVLMRLGEESRLQINLGNGHNAKIGITPRK